MTPSEAMVVAAEFRKQGRKTFGDRVMFIRDDGDTQIGAIHIPGEIKKQSGTIVMIGVDVDLSKHDVAIGDRILFTRYLPPEIELNRLDDQMVLVNIVHISDLYVGWDAPELSREYRDACASLGVEA